MDAKDKRTKATTELFTSIKFIKINALEEFFITRVSKLRHNELVILFRDYLVGCVSVFSNWITPMLVINATFGLYILLGNKMTAANTFTIVSLFNIL